MKGVSAQMADDKELPGLKNNPAMALFSSEPVPERYPLTVIFITALCGLFAYALMLDGLIRNELYRVIPGGAQWETMLTLPWKYYAAARDALLLESVIGNSIIGQPLTSAIFLFIVEILFLKLLRLTRGSSALSGGISFILLLMHIGILAAPFCVISYCPAELSFGAAVILCLLMMLLVLFAGESFIPLNEASLSIAASGCLSLLFPLAAAGIFFKFEGCMAFVQQLGISFDEYELYFIAAFAAAFWLNAVFTFNRRRKLKSTAPEEMSVRARSEAVQRKTEDRYPIGKIAAAAFMLAVSYGSAPLAVMYITPEMLPVNVFLVVFFYIQLAKYLSGSGNSLISVLFCLLMMLLLFSMMPVFTNDHVVMASSVAAECILICLIASKAKRVPGTYRRRTFILVLEVAILGFFIFMAISDGTDLNRDLLTGLSIPAAILFEALISLAARFKETTAGNA